MRLVTCNKNSEDQNYFFIDSPQSLLSYCFFKDQEDACVMASLQNLKILILVYVLSINMILFPPEAQNLNN